MNLTGVVLTKNEEKNIDRALNSLSICHEIIIVDDGSTDKTLSFAKKSGAKIISHELKYDFSRQRNYALSKANNEWVLFIDADEVLSKSLEKEIRNLMTKDNKVNGYYLNRLDIVWGKKMKHGESGSVKLLRLARKSKGKWRRSVHEYWDIKGEKKIIGGHLLHYPHPNSREFIKSINKWSLLHSQENKKEGKKSTLAKIMLYPLVHFLRNYLFRSGYKDETEGFVYAVLMSFHSFLSWSNLWLIQKKHPKN